MENLFDAQKIQQITSYLQAVQDHKAMRKQILLENEQAITPIAASFYGEYTIYKITYACLAIEESEDGEDDFNFGLEGKKAKVEKYEAYAITDQPDKDGYYLCFDPFSRFHGLTQRVKFLQVAAITEHKVLLTDRSVRDTGAWVFPLIEIPNASATGMFGNGSEAHVYFPPTADPIELRQRLMAVVKPLPAEPKYADFGLTDNEYRALRSLNQ